MLHQPGDSKTRETEASAYLALSSPSIIQGSLGKWILLPFLFHLQLTSFLFAVTSSCLMYSFPKSPSAIPRARLCVFTKCVQGLTGLWEVCAGNFWVRSFFKMGFNRDDCLTMGSSIKYLWVANCFSLIRTRGAFSCHVKGFKIFALLELFQP